MIDDRSESRNPATDANEAVEEQRRILELELTKIRNQASAARLDARAAEIELMIRALRPGVQSEQPRRGTTAEGNPINAPHLANTGHYRFTSWDDLRHVQPATKVVITEVPDTEAPDTEAPSSEAPGNEATGSEVSSTEVSSTQESDTDQLSVAVADEPMVRRDAAEPAVRRPHYLNLDLDQDEPEKIIVGADQLSEVLAIDEELEDESSESGRGKPAAWLISAVAHVAILLALAAIGIQTHRPKDQVSITASAPEVSEVSMETFEMESSEPESEPTETTTSEVEYDLSPDGEVAITEISSDSPPAPPSPAAASMSSSTSAAAAMSLKSESEAKIQFCGVEGGGNHFVYLVDCSSSMKEGFQSARKELLSSIEALTPKQRFYVVFFDAKPDYMRLRNAGQDEPRSVYATIENKAALKRWAMRVAMDRGKAPYDPLRFALKLKPDVIFLLSDGEFPQGIEDLLKEENKIANLFGDSSPISIVHTISYHSKEGESRMRRIADQNQGQYRHVPKP